MHKVFLASLGLVAAVLALPATATDQAHVTLHRLSSVPIPGQPLKSFDISAVSEAQHVLVFSDRSNHAVDFVDTRTDRFAGRAAGFSSGGPNGVVAVGDGEFWAGDGGSKLRVVDAHTRRIVATISTGGKKRVDEVAYDPREQVVIAANNDDDPPFVSFVSTAPGHRIVGKLSFPQATDGLEQPVWNPVDGMVYLSIPVLNHRKPDGGIAVIDPRTQRLMDTIHVSQCMPAGLALGPNDQLLVGCSDDAVAEGFAPRSLILDLGERKLVAEIRQVGGSDEVWYDSSSGRYYLAAVANPHGPVLGVVDARKDTWLVNLPTGARAHSVAADSSSGKVFVPVAANSIVKGCTNGCVEVFGGE